MFLCTAKLDKLFHRMLDVLEDMMHLRDIKYARLDGSTLRPRRALDIKLVRHVLLAGCM